VKELFDAIVGGNDIKRSKPAPDVFLLGAEKLGLNPEECIVIEDAYAGIEAAHAAGMLAIGIGTKENLPIADKVVTSVKDLCLKDLIELHNSKS
jgi:beta-phosphoglucomutase